MAKCREGDLEDLGEGYEEGVKVPHPRQAAPHHHHSSAITLGPLLRPPPTPQPLCVSAHTRAHHKGSNKQNGGAR